MTDKREKKRGGPIGARRRRPAKYGASQPERWTREWLESLAEDGLRDEVLKPLFSEMGFCGILDHHGGSLEQGKDLVMWRLDVTGGRENHAVVAKAKRISGVSRDAFEVLAQVEQCFAAPFLDKETLAREKVDSCWIVSSHDILTEGTHALGPLLEARGFAGRFRIVDGADLWLLVLKHLQPLGALRAAISKLPEWHSDWTYQVTAFQDRTEVALVPRVPSPQPIPLQIQPAFEISDSGERKREEWESFLRTGDPVEFGEGSGAEVPVPEQLRSLLPGAGGLRVQSVRLGGRSKLEPPLRAAVQVWAAESLIAELPFIEFGGVQGGSEETSIDNFQQAIPFHLRIVIGKGRRPDQASFRFTPAGASIRWARLGLGFLRALARGATLHVRDLEDGRDKYVASGFEGAMRPIPDEVLEFLERAERIESALGVRVAIPDRSFPLLADEEQLRLLEALVGGGHFESGLPTVGFLLEAREGLHRAMVEKLLSGQAGEFKMAWQSVALQFLDNAIPVGPLEVSAKRVEIHPDDRQVALEFSDRARDGEQLRLRLVPSPGCKFTLRLIPGTDGSNQPVTKVSDRRDREA